jgi:hypothetical protein
MREDKICVRLDALRAAVSAISPGATAPVTSTRMCHARTMLCGWRIPTRSAGVDCSLGLPKADQN